MPAHLAHNIHSRALKTKNTVIPAQAGIQRKNVPRSGHNRDFVRYAGLFTYLDSGLRRNETANGLF